MIWVWIIQHILYVINAIVVIILAELAARRIRVTFRPVQSICRNKHEKKYKQEMDMSLSLFLIPRGSKKPVKLGVNVTVKNMAVQDKVITVRITT